MKNIKNILFLLANVTIVTSSNTQAAPTFELYNKADKAIAIVLGRQEYIVQSMKQFALNMNTSNTIYLEVYPNTSSVQELRMKMAEYNPNKFRINALGKTVYLSWSPTKGMPLYPQTGPLMGLMGKTESGYSLKNNLSSSMIQKY